MDSEGKPVDVEFYRTFWGLQAYFADPPRALQPGNWARVATGGWQGGSEEGGHASPGKRDVVA